MRTGQVIFYQTKWMDQLKLVPVVTLMVQIVSNKAKGRISKHVFGSEKYGSENGVFRHILHSNSLLLYSYRSIHLEVFLRKGLLKICSKFAGEHPCRSATSTKLLCSFIVITLRYGCSLVNLLDIFRTPFPRNIFGWLLLLLFLF